MATATSQGRDPLFVSKSVRAAEIKIRFADIIVKSSSNKPEAMMKMRREKQRKLLQEEKARMRMRQEARLAVLKVEEEEARSDYLRDDKLFLIDHHVTSAQISKGIRAYHSCIVDMNNVNKVKWLDDTSVVGSIFGLPLILVILVVLCCIEKVCERANDIRETKQATSKMRRR
ncbi:uncharacterized protein LOC130505826 isoform X1 [Raphanus sativus]|uniref:Uncharacterized protein LOC130505826 isoform X1 n=1 Tax=Raphanus sativus TaxID=3726 RepID=A0A9W3CZ11_RAPSA|nr:uncharacterized protein LOC130505826 isoform X1 [Raphanus sativus]